MKLRKIISVMLMITVLIANLMTVNATPSLRLVSYEAFGGGVLLTFSENIDGTNINDKIVVVSDSSTKLSGYTIDVLSNTVVVHLSLESVSKTSYIVLNKSLVAVSGNSIDDVYKIEVAETGYTQDFGSNYRSGDWLFRTIASNSASNNVSIINDMARLIDNFAGTGYPTQPTFIYKNNYSTYNMGSTTTEFDYLRNENSDVANNWANTFRVFTRFSSFNVVAYVAKYNGYFFDIINSGVTMNLKKSVLAADGVTMTQTNLTTIPSSYALALNTKYRIRMVTRDVATGVNIKIYRAVYDAEQLGAYTLICDYTDAINPLLNGDCVFFGGGATGFNNHLIDNVMQAKAEIKNVFTASDIKADVESKITALPDVDSITIANFNQVIEISSLIDFLTRNGILLEDIAGNERYTEIKNLFPSVTDSQIITNFTTNTVKVEFSTPMTNDILSKSNVSLKKGLVALDDYQIEGIYSGDSLNGITVSFFNDRNYDTKYKLTISKNCKANTTLNFADDYSFEFYPYAPITVATPFLSEDAANVTIVSNITNNSLTENQDYVLVFGLVSETIDGNGNKIIEMLDCKQFVGTIKTTDSVIPVSAIFNKPSVNYKCVLIAWDAINSLKQLYKTQTN